MSDNDEKQSFPSVGRARAGGGGLSGNNTVYNNQNMNENASLKNLPGMAKIILVGVIAILASSVYAHIMGTYHAGFQHVFVSDPTIGGLKLLFSAIMGLILVMGLLFTPTKSLKSPLLYIAESAGKAYQSYKDAGSDDAEKKTNLLIEFVVLILIELALTGAYFFLIKNVVKYDDSYMIDESIGMITVISVGFVIAVFVAFTSWIVTKLKEIDENKSLDEGLRQKEKNKLTFIMVIGVVICISIGNALSGWAVEKAQANDGIISSIMQILGGERESIGGGEAELDIFH